MLVDRARADRAAAWFLSRILVGSALVFVVWWFVDPSQAFPATLAVLVVTCPCALSLATPAVLAAATAGVMGGGDTKLIFALLPSLTAFGCLQFVVVASICGGLLGIIVLAASRLLRRHRPDKVAATRERGALAQWLRHEAARLRRGRSIPYVPAIAFGWFTTMSGITPKAWIDRPEGV